MIDAICPSCGRGGSISSQKVNTRLVCRNCMQVFHVNARNLCVKGEPPGGSMVAEKVKEKAPRAIKEGAAPDFGAIRGPFKIAAGVLLVVVLCWLAYPFVFSGPETLEQKAVRIARAILDKDDARLEKATSTESRDEAKRWAAEVRPKLDRFKNRWPGHDLNVSALVINENKNQGRAEVIAYFSPPQALARTGSASGDILADSSGKLEPMALTLHWLLDRSDRWFLDAKASAKANAQ